MIVGTSGDKEMKFDIGFIPYISSSGGILSIVGIVLYSLYYRTSEIYFEYGKCLMVVGAVLVVSVFIYTYMIFTKVLFESKNKKCLNKK
jgi:hypothetical protein